MPSHERSRARPATLILAAILAAVPASLASVDEEYERAATTILCDCGCHPQSVHDCACSRAAEMRGEIRAMIEKGQTGEQVIAHYVAERGESIRIAPVARGFNLLAWLGPLAALGVALVALVLVARRWAARARSGPAPAPDVRRADDLAYRERLRREIEDLR